MSNYQLQIRHSFKKKLHNTNIYIHKFTTSFDQLTTKVICFKIIFPLLHLTILLIIHRSLFKKK